MGKNITRLSHVCISYRFVRNDVNIVDLMEPLHFVRVPPSEELRNLAYHRGTSAAMRSLTFAHIEHSRQTAVAGSYLDRGPCELAVRQSQEYRRGARPQGANPK
uniref:Uncharacterized protein n=1 Tax=Cacopsylla melanoneura TaxID=428564 RepID=A0A8D8X907_9HEMI